MPAVENCFNSSHNIIISSCFFMSFKKSRMPIGIGIAFVNYGDLSGILLDQNCISILWVLVSWYQFVMPSEAMQFWVSLIALKKLPQANWGWISMCKGTTALC